MASSCATDAAASVVLEGVSVRPAAGCRHVLRDAHLALYPGQCAILSGPTGSGKSTLLRAIAGVLPPGAALEGRVAVRGRVVLLLQDVETQLLFSTVEEEVVSGLRGATRGELRRRAQSALARVGLAGFGPRSVDALSAGEKQRVVLAALLALEPCVLLLDEPTSALDPPARQRLVAILGALRRAGHTLALADHVLAPFRELADACWTLKEGSLQRSETVPADGGAAPAARPAPGPGASDVVRAEALCVRDASGRDLLDRVSVHARRGERLLVSGGNGCGKTTLLRVLAGLVPPSAGRIAVRPPDGPGRIGFLFQNPQRNLFETSVAQEVSFTLRRQGRPEADVRRRLREVLARCGLDAVRERSPLRLSFGEQHRVALASVLAPEPELLLLDEPASGLDPESRRRMLDTLAREQERTGAAVILASHDAEAFRGWAHRTLTIRRGALPA